MTGAQNFLEIHADEASALKSFGALAMRTIKTTTGAEIALDGDLLAIMETLYREVTAKRELERSFEDMMREITHLIDQMDDDGATRLPAGEPVPQYREVRERQARSVHEEADEIEKAAV